MAELNVDAPEHVPLLSSKTSVTAAIEVEVYARYIAMRQTACYYCTTRLTTDGKQSHDKNKDPSQRLTHPPANLMAKRESLPTEASAGNGERRRGLGVEGTWRKE